MRLPNQCYAPLPPAGQTTSSPTSPKLQSAGAAPNAAATRVACCPRESAARSVLRTFLASFFFSLFFCAFSFSRLSFTGAVTGAGGSTGAATSGAACKE